MARSGPEAGPQAGGAVRFTLLTYNIHKGVGTDRRYDPQRIAEVLRHHDADVVLLQEVDRHAERSQRIDLAALLARELSYAHRAVSMNVYRKTGRYGNATLSRHPIVRQRNIDLSVRGMIRRGAQHARILLPARGGAVHLDVFNVHLGLLASERMRQVRSLIGCGDLHALGHHDACVIAGDMNDWRGRLRDGLLGGLGFACATDRRPDSRWAIRTYPAYAPAAGLDKVFYRGPLRLLSADRSRLVAARKASDHLPVIAQFEFDVHQSKLSEDE
jgi:endonuclease/exonuclease/phosphatase family metal-dependent hydrolase